MDFSLSPKLQELQARTRAFIANDVMTLENDPGLDSLGPSVVL
jgi:hypothetical protein